MSNKDLADMSYKEIKEEAKRLKVKEWWTFDFATLVSIVKDVRKELNLESAPKVERKVRKANEPAETTVQIPDEVKRENITTLQDILDKLKKEGKPIKGSKARRILRTGNIERPFENWEWDNKLHKDIIKEVERLLRK
jgi:hypothetical protein